MTPNLWFVGDWISYKNQQRMIVVVVHSTKRVALDPLGDDVEWLDFRAIRHCPIIHPGPHRLISESDESAMMGLFFQAMRDKFIRRSSGFNRSLTPWKDFDINWLGNRLADELREFAEASGFPVKVDAEGEGFFIGDDAADEIIDVANLLMFIWLRRELSKRGQ